jgi:hypothetical protein
MALLEAGVLLADLSAGGRHGDITELSLYRGDAKSSILVPGAFTIRDSDPGFGVLFETSEPAPRVFIVAEGDVLRLFAD